MRLRHLLLLVSIFFFHTAYSQQDMDLHLNATFLTGKNILKVKRDFHDPYLWVLAQNNEVYRINSVTQTVDDYTSQFSAYSGVVFTDIAGRSQDTVFIATNSTNVIEYKKGTLKVIGNGSGLTGTINQIGMDYLYEASQKTQGFPLSGLKLLMLATSTNIYYYDIENEVVLSSNIEPANDRLFETTYRSEAYSNIGLIFFDPVKQFSNAQRTLEGTFRGALGYNTPEFGYTINTAYYIRGSYFPYPIYGYEDIFFMNQVWGTETGLFQNNRDESYPLSSAYKHYLSGIKVNKITSIYGLTAFESTQYTGLTKENLLVGTDQGLYFSNSGYAKYIAGINSYNTFTHEDEIGNKVINDICVNATSYNTTVCEDGAWVAASDGLYLIKPDYAPYLNSTQKFKAIAFSGLNDTVSTLQVCANTSISVVTTAYSGNEIQWYKDGQELPNESNSTLNITQTGDYNAVLYDPCAAIHVESNHLKLSIITVPVFSFNYPDQLSYCDGSTAALKTDNNSIYQYRWYKDGILNGNTTYTLNITQSGKYKVEVSSCAGNWVTSKEVQLNFIKVSQSVITADKPAYCIGDLASLSINFINNGSYAISWFLNGNLLSANQNKTSLQTNQPGNYTVNISSTLSNCSQFSTPYILSFSAIPTINILQVANTNFCNGTTVNLKASYSSGSVKWSTGETADIISVNKTGIYTATVTTAAGCIATTNTNVQFFANPILSLADATLSQFINQTITLTAPTGFAKYQWNGIQGDYNFSTNKLGTINLTVTDFNGCTASQTINITSHCDDIHIPNTFTPNGDGINDIWTIAGLEGDQSTSVKIYNRLGELLFQSLGYAKPWDGTYKGKKIPAGVYYYIISTHEGQRVLSGSLTIIY